MKKLDGTENILNSSIGYCDCLKSCKGHEGFTSGWTNRFAELNAEEEKLSQVAPVVPFCSLCIHHGLGQLGILEKDLELIFCSTQSTKWLRLLEQMLHLLLVMRLLGLTSSPGRKSSMSIVDSAPLEVARLLSDLPSNIKGSG